MPLLSDELNSPNVHDQPRVQKFSYDQNLQNLQNLLPSKPTKNSTVEITTKYNGEQLEAVVQSQNTAGDNQETMEAVSLAQCPVQVFQTKSNTNESITENYTMGNFENIQATSVDPNTSHTMAGEESSADSSPESNQSLVKIEEAPSLEYNQKSQVAQADTRFEVEDAGISENDRHPYLGVDFEEDGSAVQETVDLYIRREIPTVDGVYIKGSVQNYEIVYTVDTGASITLLSKNIFDSIPEHDKPKLHPRKPKLRDAAGNTITCYGNATFELLLGALPLKKKLIVAEITDDVLLGSDIILGDEAGPADLLFSKHLMIFRGIDIPIEVGGYPAGVRRVTLADNYRIAPMTELIADVFIEQGKLGSGENFITEPNQELAAKYGITMASSLVNINKQVTQKVRLMNPFPTEVTLRQDTVIGTAEIVRDCCVFDTHEDEEEAGNFHSIRNIKLAAATQHLRQNKLLQVSKASEGPSDGTEISGIPDHLHDLFLRSHTGKTDDQTQEIANLLKQHADVFSRFDTDIGRTHLTEHVIETHGARPVKSAPRRIPLAYVTEAEEAVQKLFDQGSARPSTSPWASPLVFVRKKNGQIRPCVDYRRLNDLTRKDAFPLPRTQDCFDAVAGATLFSSMDITSAYNQIPIREQDIAKTAFVTKYGLYEFTTMPFGLCNAPATFQRVMELALAGLQWKTCLIYLDDVLVFSKTFNEGIWRLSEVLDRIQHAQLKLKPSKCHFFQSEVAYLGHILSGEGILPNPENIEKILKWQRPVTVKEVQSFLGLANYYRRFIHSYSDHVRPLIDLTRKGAQFSWDERCEEAFDHVKSVLVSPDIMAHPRSQGEFILDTDASDVCIGAVLSQVQDGTERVIAYGSKSLNKAERNYCVTDRELLAIRYFTEYYRVYLLGKPFLIRTDHQALKWLFSMKEPKNRVARWIEALAEFDYEIHHRAGKKHQNADAMSRCPNPWDCNCKIFETLRCGPCRKCLRKTELMMGKMPDEPPEHLGVELRRSEEGDVRLATYKKVANSNLVEELVCFFSLEAMLTLFLYAICPEVMANWVWIILTHALVQYQHVVLRKMGIQLSAPDHRKVKRLMSSKDDGRTRPKNQVRISKRDLRNAWPLQTQYCDLRAKQMEDSDIKTILTWLESDQPRPQGPVVQAASPATRHYWLLWESLIIKDGVLHRMFHRHDGSSYLQCIIPKNLRKELLYQMHNVVLSGHLGYKKTRDKILQRFYWYKVRDDIYTHIQACDECAVIKGPGKRPRGPLGSMPSGAPWDRISTDITGPFPTSNSGNKYILVVTDYFSKWVEIFAVPDQTAVTCAEKILNEVISRYGCPHDLHSDQGSNYVSKIFRELCQMLEIRKTRTSPYNPKGNGQVERFNKTLVRMIKAYLTGEGKDWDKHLGCLAGAYRATIHETTGFTPNMLLMGREVRMPAQLTFECPGSTNYTCYGDYVEGLRLRMEKAHEVAREHLGKAAKRQKDAYDGKCVLHVYNPGDLVWYATPTAQVHIAPKLRKCFIGPVLIVEKKNDLNYVIQVDRRKEMRVVNHDKLYPYKGTQRPSWIKVALKNLKS